MPKFKCDFCKRRSTKAAMEAHERRCFRNPNRYCDYCDNKGFIEMTEDIYSWEEPCFYCSKRDTNMERAIKEYEARLTAR